MRLAQVVRHPRVQMLSLTPTGTPASGSGSPAASRGASAAASSRAFGLIESTAPGRPPYRSMRATDSTTQCPGATRPERTLSAISAIEGKLSISGLPDHARHPVEVALAIGRAFERLLHRERG